MVDEHRRSLLHIVGTRMKHRVEGERRSTAEIMTIFAPWHKLVAVANNDVVGINLKRVYADACRSLFGKSLAESLV